MIGIKNILVPVDFSDASKTAVNYGLSLALQFNAHLILAHIVQQIPAHIYTFPVLPYDFEVERAKFAESALPDLVPMEYRNRVELQTIVKMGEVRSELLDLVAKEKIDLVVMGTHGQNAFERFVLGSVTERMLRKIPVPILTVCRLDPARELHTTGPVPLHRILYATDLSDNSGVGLKFSIELARGAAASLSVLHVFPAMELIYWGAEGGYLGEGLLTLRDEALKRLQDLIPKDCKGVTVTPVMTDGNPFQEILRVADKEKADLIVMNLQGKNLIQRALLGSTAERVIRSSDVPVLSIPVPAEYAERMLDKDSAA